jgi:hypothetical protein
VGRLETIRWSRFLATSASLVHEKDVGTAIERGTIKGGKPLERCGYGMMQISEGSGERGGSSCVSLVACPNAGIWR